MVARARNGASYCDSMNEGHSTDKEVWVRERGIARGRCLAMMVMRPRGVCRQDASMKDAGCDDKGCWLGMRVACMFAVTGRSEGDFPPSHAPSRVPSLLPL